MFCHHSVTATYKEFQVVQQDPLTACCTSCLDHSIIRFLSISRTSKRYFDETQELVAACTLVAEGSLTVLKNPLAHEVI